MSSDKVVSVVIENGTLTFLATDSADIFLEQGKTITRRASHVEPATIWLRPLFHFLRLFGNKNKIAEWTRHWPYLWRVNTRPVGGPILTWADIPSGDGLVGVPDIALWRNRQDAIDAEIKFLNEWFAR